MSADAYRDGAAHERNELEAERERLTSLDVVRGNGPEALTGELAELRARVRAPITSSIDATQRRDDLQSYDAAIQAATLARTSNQRRRRARLVVGGGCLLFAAVGPGAILASYEHKSEACRMRDGCATEGRCAASLSALIYGSRPRHGDECVARSEEHCERACGLFGRCALEDGRCVAKDDAACAASEACRCLGDCSKVGDRCQPTTRADCTGSQFCQTERRCQLRERDCLIGRCLQYCTR